MGRPFSTPRDARRINASFQRTESATNRVGDYPYFYLPDPVWCSNTSYFEFLAHSPVFVANDKLLAFPETYISLPELTVWASTLIFLFNRHWKVTP